MLSKYSSISFLKYRIYVVYLIPILLLVAFIARFGVNVPFADEWALVDIFHKVYTGEVTIRDFFAQHNEHRILFPRLFFLALAFPSKWNITYEQYFNVFLSAIAFLAICKLAFQQTLSPDKQWVHIANVTTCALLFSIIQHETWLSGFQLTWVLINVCVVLAIFLLADSRSDPAKFLLAALLCFVASFSSAHGLLSWLALLPSIICLSGSWKKRLLRTVFWLILFSGSLSLYLVGYHKPGYHPDLFYFLESPWNAIDYLLTLLGSSLIRSQPGAGIAGFILITLFIIIFASCLRNIKLLQLFSPWLSLGAFAIAFALITTLGRAGFGVNQAMSTRYITTTIFLTVALVQIWRLLLYSKENLAIKKMFGKRQFQFFSFILIGICLVNAVQAIPTWRADWNHKFNAKACLELINYMDESHFVGDAPNSCLRHLFPATPPLKPWAAALDEIGFRDFPQDIEFVPNPSSVYGYAEISTATKSSIVERGDTVSVSGWAILPDNSRVPQIVLLSHGDSKRFFASAYIGEDSPQAVQALGSGHYRKVGWSTNFVPVGMPSGDVAISSWVYDPDEKQFVKLNGEPRIEVVEKQ